MSCVSTRQMSWPSTRHMSYVSTLRYVQCSQPTQRKAQRGGGQRPPPLVEATEGRFLCVGCTGHIFVLRRKTCALLRAKTSALLRRKTCALFRANTKVAAFGRHHSGAAVGRPPFVVSFVLAVNTGHLLVLRRKTCALLRAKTSALLSRMTCAVLRAGTWGAILGITLVTLGCPWGAFGCCLEVQ